MKTNQRIVAFTFAFALNMAVSIDVVADVITQYSFEGDLLDTAPGGAVADNLYDETGARLGVGAAVYAPGVPGVGGSAIEFEQESGLALLGAFDSVDLSLGDTWSIELFVNTTDDEAGFKRLVLKWDDALPNGFENLSYHVDIVGRGVDLFYSSDGTLDEFSNPIPGGTGATVPADGAWHHIAITNDANNAVDGLKSYLDGVLDQTAPGISVFDGADNLGLGGNQLVDARNGAGFNGLMDEVLIHNMVVDQAYISGRAALAIPEPGSHALVGLGLTLTAFIRARRLQY